MTTEPMSGPVVTQADRDDVALAMLAAWLNVRPDQIPAENRAHTCAHTMAAWHRVADAARTATEAASKQRLDAANHAHGAMRDRAHAAEATVAELVEALEDLAVCEAEYRHEHDVYGDGNIMTGRAWDRMRRAGDRARALLSRVASPAEQGGG